MESTTTYVGDGGTWKPSTPGRVAGICRRVLLAGYNQEILNSVAAQLRGEGYDGTTHPVDISDRDAVDALAYTAASAGDVTSGHRGRCVPGPGDHRTGPPGNTAWR